MLLGVTLVKRTRVGRRLNASDMVSERRLVNTTKTASLIPKKVMLSLRISTKLIKHPTTLVS